MLTAGRHPPLPLPVGPCVGSYWYVVKRSPDGFLQDLGAGRVWADLAQHLLRALQVQVRTALLVAGTPQQASVVDAFAEFPMKVQSRL